MRPSRLIKPFVRWRPRRDGKPGLEPNWAYEVWARMFTIENRMARLWRWHAIAPGRHALGLPHSVRDSNGWR